MYKVGSTEGPPANFSAGVTLGALQERVPSATLGVLRQARLLTLYACSPSATLGVLRQAPPDGSL